MIPDNIWENYLLKFEADEGCGFQVIGEILYDKITFYSYKYIIQMKFYNND